MSTDRELLELAAKAAGMQHMRWSGPSGLSRMLDPTRPESTGSIGGYWNPLTDDGDALRLAVKLQIRLSFEANGPHDSIRIVEAYTPVANDGSCVCPMETQGDDPCAATRRVIVRAAAAIGRAMP